MVVVIAFARRFALLAVGTLLLTLLSLRASAHGPAPIGALGQTGRLQLAFGSLLTISLAVSF